MEIVQNLQISLSFSQTETQGVRAVRYRDHSTPMQITYLCNPGEEVVKPFTPRSDKYVTSPNNIHILTYTQVIRILN